MCAEGKKPWSEDDQELDRLLMGANQVGDDTFTRPSNEAIQAYLLGHASKSQTDDVRHALLVSSEFRREMATLTEELSEIDSPGVKKDLESIPNVAVPDLSRYMSDISTEKVRRLSSQNRLGEFVNALFRPRWAAAFGVLIFAIASFALLQNDQLPLGTLSLVRQQVAPDDIIRIAPREVGNTFQESSFQTAELAALAAFRSSLSYQDGEFVVDNESNDSKVLPPTAKVLLRVKFIDARTLDVEGMLPSDAFKDEQRVSVWLLFLPERKLYMGEMPTEKLEVEVVDRGTRGGLAAFIWLENGSYHVGAVRRF